MHSEKKKCCSFQIHSDTFSYGNLNSWFNFSLNLGRVSSTWLYSLNSYSILNVSICVL